ncbi:MAG: O-antigen ligase family protein [Gammaproteobacteria bacterium]
MSERGETRLLLAARILLLTLPLWLISGRAAVDADLSLIVILFVVRSIMLRDWGWARSTWFRIGLGLWAWMLFITPFAYDPALSFSQAAPWIRFLVFAAALESWVLDEVWMRRLLWVATAILIYTSLDALLQYFHGSDIFGDPRWSPERLTAMFERPRVGIFITKLMFPVVFGAFAWHGWRRGRLWPSIGFAGLVLLLLSAIFLSGERMALLLALLGLTLGAVLQKGPLRILVATVMSLGIVGMVVLSILNPVMIKRHIDETYNTMVHLPDSPYGMIWNSGLHLAMAHPVLGAGMKNFLPPAVAGGSAIWLRGVVDGAAGLDGRAPVAAWTVGEFLFQLGGRHVVAGGGVGPRRRALVGTVGGAGRRRVERRDGALIAFGLLRCDSP